VKKFYGFGCYDTCILIDITTNDACCVYKGIGIVEEDSYQ
jgi:hypothetical protein